MPNDAFREAALIIILGTRTHYVINHALPPRFEAILSVDGQETVEGPGEIRPALQRAWKKVEEGMVGFVNVKTDYRARATTVRFSSRET